MFPEKAGLTSAVGEFMNHTDVFLSCAGLIENKLILIFLQKKTALRL
jgi:hypothetical protein